MRNSSHIAIVLPCVTRFFCALMFLPALTAAQTVEGTVANSITGTGIDGVKVDLAYGGDLYYSATTDAHGHFLFDHVQDGVYNIRYSSPDYFLQRQGLRQVQVTAGTPVHLDARMTALAKVSGRVVDPSGKPVPGASVAVSGPESAMSARADRNGHFELHEMLLPGAYTLSAAPAAGFAPPAPDSESGRSLNWTRTYYPGVPTYEAASKITLSPGSQASDLEIKLLAVPAHTVAGVLLNPDGSPAKGEISLVGDMALLKAQSKPDGTFEFPAVVNGEWNFTAEVEGKGLKLRASYWIEMSGRDLDGVKLRLAAPFTLRGKVLIETPEGAPTPRQPSVALAPHLNHALHQIIPDNGIMGYVSPGSPDTRADADGNLTWKNVYPDTYRVVPILGPPGYYLDSVRLGDAELSTAEMEISSGAASFTIVYKTNGGTVRGTAEKCAAGGVLLLPQDPAMRRPGFAHSTPCDPNDRYQIGAVRPGDYYVLAFSGDSPEPWSRARVDETVLTQATKVTVRAGETSSLDLRATAPSGN